MDEKLIDAQAGFRGGRSRSNQIFALRILLEKVIGQQMSMMLNFIDFEKAFDSLHWESPWKIMSMYHIPDKYIHLIKDLYQRNECFVMVDGQETEWFSLQTGVRQDCILCHFLFCLAIDWLMKVSVDEKENGIKIGTTTWLDDLDFVDHIVLLSQDSEKMQD